MSNSNFKIESFTTPSAFDPSQINESFTGQGGAGTEFNNYLASTAGTTTVDVNTFLVLSGTGSSRNVVVSGPSSAGSKFFVKSFMDGVGTEDVNIEVDTALIEDIGAAPGTLASSTTIGFNVGNAYEFTYTPINATGSAYLVTKIVN